jgi:hypothetical protein
MIYFLLMTVFGLALFIGAWFLDRTVARQEPRLAVIEPVIPLVCFVAKSAGAMTVLVGLGATAWTLWS